MRLKTVPIAINNKLELKEYNKFKKSLGKTSDVTKATKEFWRNYGKEEN